LSLSSLSAVACTSVAATLSQLMDAAEGEPASKKARTVNDQMGEQNKALLEALTMVIADKLDEKMSKVGAAITAIAASTEDLKKELREETEARKVSETMLGKQLEKVKEQITPEASAGTASSEDLKKELWEEMLGKQLEKVKEQMTPEASAGTASSEAASTASEKVVGFTATFDLTTPYDTAIYQRGRTEDYGTRWSRINVGPPGADEGILRGARYVKEKEYKVSDIAAQVVRTQWGKCAGALKVFDIARGIPPKEWRTDPEATKFFSLMKSQPDAPGFTYSRSRGDFEEASGAVLLVSGHLVSIEKGEKPC